MDHWQIWNYVATYLCTRTWIQKNPSPLRKANHSSIPESFALHLGLLNAGAQIYPGWGLFPKSPTGRTQIKLLWDSLAFVNWRSGGGHLLWSNKVLNPRNTRKTMSSTFSLLTPAILWLFISPSLCWLSYLLHLAFALLLNSKISFDRVRSRKG